jgi:hypothetical protein
MVWKVKLLRVADPRSVEMWRRELHTHLREKSAGEVDLRRFHALQGSVRITRAERKSVQP